MQSGGGGTLRVAMNLVQNYILRNSIDRSLIGAVGGSSMAMSNIRRGFGTSGKEYSSTSTSNQSVQSTLDKESLTKLNALKEGLQMKNDYFEKYKDKLKKLESVSPRELLAKLEQLEEQKNENIRRFKSADNAAAKKPKSLNDVMHTDSIKNLERDDIINLWQEFHRHKEGLLAAVMSGAVYDKMKDLASVHKMFVMPLPRTDGHEYFFMQFEDDTFHFTPLIMYQTHKESAPVSLRLINYTDLKSSKDLVLLRGEYDAKILKAEDAHFLAVQTNFYYGETNESRLHLLENFTKHPDQFNHLALIDELAKIKETHAQLFEFEPNDKSNIS